MRSLPVILVAVVLLGTLAMAIGLGLAQDPSASHMPAVQRYLPDQEQAAPWRPDPQREKTLYAQRLVLQGENCLITIDATGRQPGICVQSTRSRERCHVYLSPDGTAVIGVASGDRKELSAGLWADRRTGYLQVADPYGVHLFSGAELDGGRRSTGALKQ
jgi:hypothetical protein